MIRVAIIGDGQLGQGVATLLRTRPDVELIGPAARRDHETTTALGADVVIIATTTRLADVAPHIEAAVAAGSHVIVSAEEAAFPWVVDPGLAQRIDAASLAQGVTVLGCGLNPGFVFDSLVLTLLGTCSAAHQIEVERTVDLSGFGSAVRARLGLGVTPERFMSAVATGEILGHAGFPQSISIVAHALGLVLDTIETSIEPLVVDGITEGVRQRYAGIIEGRQWFVATFLGHLSPETHGWQTRDTIRIHSPESSMSCVIEPGIGAQAGSRSLIANSIDRVIAARAGWLTVAELPPAHPIHISTSEENHGQRH